MKKLSLSALILASSLSSIALAQNNGTELDSSNTLTQSTVKQEDKNFRITMNGIFPESSVGDAFRGELYNLEPEEEKTPEVTTLSSSELKANNAPGLKANSTHGRRGKAYTVRGKRYVPFASISEFSETGQASWYGPGFHGRLTANGERYNQHELTAAHKELPLNSVIRVTRVSTGKSIVVRVNDRGPFHGNRVLDLSYGAAKQLGIVQKGSDKVKIELISSNSGSSKKAKQRKTTM